MKDAWPALSVDDALRAVKLWTERFGGGSVQLTGGEPLLEPQVVRAVLDHVVDVSSIERVLLCTNGLALTADWLRTFAAHPKTALVLSLDGRPDDHRRHRHATEPFGDAYDRIVSLLPDLLRTPRLIVTQTIAPDTAAGAADNFEHLLSLGFSRFKFLPVYYHSWKDEQLVGLRNALGDIAAAIRSRWAADDRLYVRNLFTWAPTPLFNTGLVVDSDGTIHATNAGLASACAELLSVTRIGTLDDPPSIEALTASAASVRTLLERTLPAPIWQSTMAVDAELTRFCRGLYPDFLEYRKRRRATA